MTVNDYTAEQLAAVPVPPGLTYVGAWERRTMPELGRWLSVGDWTVPLGGYAENPQAGSVSVIAWAYQCASGAIAFTYVEAESSPDRPMVPSEARELAAVLTRAADELDKLSDSGEILVR
ncbi:hypothetical protein [[Mycobacterium] crassicus]|uniref:Uncharacterized protein n=1 Tax=[Mycobacterium] crassicus TaxID=2872309 RepID=A0ABU5XNX6_9MYCO|nr:hypothetical protein [Mycolicibacter sp. MYC098]MEB3023911.1 hypothetical protein [Mycolicibacter sp. MYC098]